jgi:hypothetical protein
MTATLTATLDDVAVGCSERHNTVQFVVYGARSTLRIKGNCLPYLRSFQKVSLSFTVVRPWPRAFSPLSP